MRNDRSSTKSERGNEEAIRMDILKGIAIILVVYIHAYNTGAGFEDQEVVLELPAWLSAFEDILSQCIARSAVPLFFLLSGIFAFRSKKTYGQNLKTKLRTLLVPYLIWNTLWIVVFFVLQRVPVTAVYFANPRNKIDEYGVMEWLRAYGISWTLEQPFLYPFWFIRDLMLLNLLLPLLKYLLKKLPYVVLWITILLLFINVDFPLRMALCYFLSGGLWNHFGWKIERMDKTPLWERGGLYTLLIVLQYNLQNSFLNTLMIVVGIGFWMKVSGYLYQNSRAYQICQRVIPYTFLIYAGHEMTLSSFQKLAMRILPHTPGVLFAEYFFLPIFVVLGCICVGYFLKRYFGDAYRVLTGGR